jgi:hypothetical protein
MRTFLQKLNWRLMLIHFIAFCLFILAFREFMFLHDRKYMFDISDAIIHKKNMSDFSGIRFSKDILWIGIAGLIGLLAAFAISLTVCIRNKWFWLNALLSFLTTFFLYKFIIQFSLGYYINHLFFHLPIWIRLSGTGCIILFAGCYLLLSTRVSKFIEKDRFAFTHQTSTI